MTLQTTLLIGISTGTFIAAASAAKIYTENSTWGWLLGTLALYTIGNLIMLRLIRDIGMGAALSLSAVVQLVAINLIAMLLSGEKVTWTQTAGQATAVVSVGLFILGPYFERG